jgi:hypothetical protein
VHNDVLHRQRPQLQDGTGGLLPRAEPISVPNLIADVHRNPVPQARSKHPAHLGIKVPGVETETAAARQKRTPLRRERGQRRDAVRNSGVCSRATGARTP